MQRAFLLKDLAQDVVDDTIFYNLTIDLAEYPELQYLVSSMVDRPDARNVFGISCTLKLKLSESKDISKYQPRGRQFMASSSLIESFVSNAKRTFSFLSKNKEDD